MGDARSGNPMGGLSASAPDQIRWARFHLDHGRNLDGTQVVSPELIDRMQQPTVEMPGSDLGDAVGISWLLSDAGGEKVVSTADRRPASSRDSRWCRRDDSRFVSLTNAEPNGPLFNRRISGLGAGDLSGARRARRGPRGAVRRGLGRVRGSVRDRRGPDDGHGRRRPPPRWRTLPKPELIAQLGEDADYHEPPVPIGMLPDGDRYVVPSGPYERIEGILHARRVRADQRHPLAGPIRTSRRLVDRSAGSEAPAVGPAGAGSREDRSGHSGGSSR